MTRSMSTRPVPIVLFCALAVLAVAGGRAEAQQGFGFRGGGTIDPDQGFFGMHYFSQKIGGGPRAHLGADAGFGDGATLAAFHVDFAGWFELNPRWQLYLGGGPTVNVYRFDVGGPEDSETWTRAGLESIVGIAHESGFLAELRVGTGDSPNLRLVVGYTLW